MLVLTRKRGETITIQLAEDVDPNITIGELFAGGGIKVMVTRIDAKQVRIGIGAKRQFLILRNERAAQASRDTSIPHP